MARKQLGSNTSGANDTATVGGSQSLSNKRIAPRIDAVTSSATPAINVDTTDQFNITTLATNITSMSSGLTGTPVDGQRLRISILATAPYTITWGSSFEDSTIPLPVVTNGQDRRLDIDLIYNIATTKWRMAVENLSHLSLITNSEFDANITGWTGAGSGIWSYSSGTASWLAPGSAFGTLTGTGFPVTVGQYYGFRVNASSYSLFGQTSIYVEGYNGSTWSTMTSLGGVTLLGSTGDMMTSVLVPASITQLRLVISAFAISFGGTVNFSYARAWQQTLGMDDIGWVRPATGTFTNKRITPRVGTITSTPAPSISTDSYDQYNITALAVAITSMTNNLSGTPTDGQKLLIRIKDAGTAQTITWGSSFTSSGIATLLSTTVAGKEHLVGLLYSSSASKWVCIAVDAAGY